MISHQDLTLEHAPGSNLLRIFPKLDKGYISVGRKLEIMNIIFIEDLAFDLTH